MAIGENMVIGANRSPRHHWQPHQMLPERVVRLGVYYPRGAILPSIGASLRIRTEVDSVQNHVGGIMDNERPFYWREPRRGAT